MGVFDLLRDMEQDDVIEAISKKVQNVEARLEKLEALVRALDAKLDRIAKEQARG